MKSVVKSMENDSAQILRRYHQYLKLEKGFSPNTIEAYQRDLDRFIEFMNANQRDFLSDDVRLEDFQHFSAALYELGIAPRSLSRILSGLRSFYHFLVLSDLKETNPTELLEFPKKAKHLPEVLTVEEVDALEACIDLSEREGHRNRAIIETLFSCGLRVSELCNLKMSNLYLDEGFIKVEGKGNKQRLVPISRRAVKELNLWFADRNLIDIKPGQEDFVFVSHTRRQQLTRVMVFYVIKSLVEKAGIQKAVSPHTLRHSFATALLEGGANLRAIQAMLGHESIATTQIYMHIDTTHLREEILLHHPRNKKP